MATASLSLNHPFAQSPSETLPKNSKPPQWTMDMDDMLRTAVRRSAFDFDAVATHIQSYVLRVRACGVRRQ